jgi:hypothetical protein
MDEATKACIFDPFFPTKEVWIGTGLGRWGSRGKKLKGAIMVTCTLNKGSTFQMFLPRFAGKADVFPKVQHQSKAAVRDAGMILVNETGNTVRGRLSKRTPGASRICILTASDGAPIALEIAEQNFTSDLLVTEITLSSTFIASCS